VTYVKGAQLAEGFSEINVPGERSLKEKVLREKEGIPLDEVTFEELQTLASQQGIPFPS